MAITLNDNIQVNAGKPVESKYLNLLNESYSSTTEVTNRITIPERFIGLTVNVNNDEYWFATGVTDSDLILKTKSSGIVINGVDNIGTGTGVFSGITTGGVINLRSFIGSGDTSVNLSGDTIIIQSTGGTNPTSDILFYNESQQTYEPYSAFTSGVTFYYGTTQPTGQTHLNLNADLRVPVLSLTTGITLSAVTRNIGDLYWDNSDETLSIKLTNEVTQQVGEENLLKVRNNTAGNIGNGNVVYLTGSDAGRATIGLARASEIDTNIVDHVIGVTTEDISAGDTGFVTLFGLVREVNTSGFTEGDILYLSTTVLGGFTNVKPAYPDYAIEIGFVTNADATNGRILIRLSDISQEQFLRNVQTVNTPYTASTRSDILSVLGGGGGFIYLPTSPLTGQTITIIDENGDAETDPITIDGNGKLINGYNEATINSNYGSISVVYNGTNWYASTITP